MFLKINDKSVVKNVDFLKEFGILYDLLIYLLGNANRIINATEDQINFFKAIHVLKTIIWTMKNDITDQSEEQKKKLFWKQASVLNNAEVLLIQRGEIIDQFTKSNIIYTPEKTIEVSKDKLDSIKLKIFRNKNLSSTITKKDIRWVM